MTRALPADLSARLAGVKPSTLRDWRYRGLLEPTSGTPRRPKYTPAALAAAKLADNPHHGARAATPRAATDRSLLPAPAAALAVGVKPSTLRDWRRRGLLTPAGGTDRRPLYALADLHAARNAPKPRRALPTEAERRPCDVLLSLEQAALVMGVKPRTIARWDHDGLITAARDASGRSRFALADLREAKAGAEGRRTPTKAA